MEHRSQTRGTSRCWLTLFAVLLIAVGALAAAPAPSTAEELEGSIARGGRLYDKWYKVIKAEEPTEAHPAYPADGAYADKADSNWRCKECHGWDYMGKDGAYGSGKHFTGIVGIHGKAGADAEEIVALLKAEPHGYEGLMDESDFVDLANFVSQGQLDMDPYIDRETKVVSGDEERGGAYYATLCANCHGDDGKMIEEMPALGKLMGNPWEVMHKILNGQPDEKMPALRALDMEITTDLMSYLATLPQE